jgi:CHAT domain-containing protein
MSSDWLPGAFEFWDATSGMVRGVDRVADVLKPTLGPRGTSVKVKAPHGVRYFTKNGAVIVEEVKAYDPFEVIGMNMVKDAAIDANRLAGDGASTTTLLAQFLVNESVRLIYAGSDPSDLQRGVDVARKAVFQALKSQTRRAATAELLAQAGITSVDGDPDVGWIIGKTVKYGTPVRPISVEGVVGLKEGVSINPFADGYEIFVPGKTRAEAEQNKFHVDTAVRAAQSAMEQGVVAGGGAALLHASRALDSIVLANRDQQAGVDMFRRALQVPIRQVVENAGVNGTSVVEKLLRESDPRIGYHVGDRTYVDMYHAGIVDSAKAVRTALDSAASVASALVTYPSMIEMGQSLDAGAKGNSYFVKMRQAVAAAGGASPGPGKGRIPSPVGSGQSGSGKGSETGTAVQPPRYLVGRFPGSIAKGDTATLTVKISTNPVHGNAGRIRDLKVPKQGLPLDIAVQADGFELLTPSPAPIRLPPAGDSTGASFDLKAVVERKTVIRISAFHGGTCVGGLQLSVQIGPPGTAPGSPEDQTGRPIGGLVTNPGDVALIVAFNDKSERYTFTWQDKNGAQQPADLGKSLAEIDLVISGIVGEIQEIVRMDLNTETAVAENKLKQRGIKLWQDLVPAQIKSQFIANHATIKRMMIVSDGDPIPWEMLYPHVAKPLFDRGFLVNQVDLSRWRFGSLPPSAIAVRRADFVVPTEKEDLESAQPEVKQVSKLLKTWNKAIKASPINEANDLLDLLEQALVSLLHFACHNAFDSANGRILVNNSPVNPGDYLSLQDRLKEMSPFVFMNACRTDGTAPEYIRIGKKEGWAQCFLDMGFGAFIGTLWEVRDKSAAEFASAVYAELVQNKSFGDALRTARETLRKKFPGDPTWLAYSFYGAPGARVQKDAAAPTH